MTANLARSARPTCRPSQSAATSTGRPSRKNHSVLIPQREGHDHDEGHGAGNHPGHQVDDGRLARRLAEGACRIA